MKIIDFFLEKLKRKGACEDLESKKDLVSSSEVRKKESYYGLPYEDEIVLDDFEDFKERKEFVVGNKRTI